MKFTFVISVLVALAYVVTVATSLSVKEDDHGPPVGFVFPHQFKSSASLLFVKQNNTVNSTIYYDWERGKIRVDQDLGMEQVHTYIGDKNANNGYFIVYVGKNLQACFKFEHIAIAVLPPDLFQHGTFLGRHPIDGVDCLGWEVQAHHGNHLVTLWVSDIAQPVPIRLGWGKLFQFDFHNFRPGNVGDPSIWDTPATCLHVPDGLLAEKFGFNV